MEIHAPDEPILTWKGAVAHLAIVTVGILIALSFEGLIEAYRHHALVREANANLTTEIRDNKEKLQRFLGKQEAAKKKFQHALDVMTSQSKREDAQTASSLPRPESGENYVLYGYEAIELGTASHTTAQMTGAFGLMEYANVKKYAAAYDTQELFRTVQQQAMNDALMVGSLGLGMDLEKASQSEPEQIRKQVRLAYGGLQWEGGLPCLVLSGA